MTKIHPRPEISRPLASTLVQGSDTGEPEPDSSASSQQAPPAPAATEVPQRGPQNDRTDVKQRLLSLLFPRRCPVCEDIVTPRGALICPDCERQLHFLSEPTCQICGREILSEEEELCENCKRHRFLFVRSLALLGYNDVAARSSIQGPGNFWTIMEGQQRCAAGHRFSAWRSMPWCPCRCMRAEGESAATTRPRCSPR